MPACFALCFLTVDSRWPTPRPYSCALAAVMGCSYPWSSLLTQQQGKMCDIICLSPDQELCFRNIQEGLRAHLDDLFDGSLCLWARAVWWQTLDSDASRVRLWCWHTAVWMPFAFSSGNTCNKWFWEEGMKMFAWCSCVFTRYWSVMLPPPRKCT